MLVLWMSCLLLMGSDGIYGEALTGKTQELSLDTLLSNPADYVGKLVAVQGQVKEVCPMAGCWMDITQNGKMVRLKVKDGEIVFNKELQGKRVAAEGVVTKMELTKDEAIRYFKHQAVEKNQSFDPTSVTSGTTIYRIAARGVAVKQAQ